MSPDSRLERRRQAARDAAEWLISLQSGRMSALERGEFIDWLRESPLHVAELLRVAEVHDTLALFSRWADVPASGLEPRNVVEFPESTGLGRRPARRRRFAAAAAAGIAVAALAGFIGFERLRQIDISTQIGERREVTLADGSVVDIAPGSELHIRLGARERRVRLARGEAFFHVAKNPSRPFIVEAAGARVRAVGTAFNVEDASVGVVVTVVEGQVAVSESRETLVRGSVPAPLSLIANEQVTIRHDGRDSPVRRVNGEVEVAWTTGQLMFDDETVAAIARRFNGYNRLKIVIADPALAARHVTGVFRASDPESFVAFLRTVTGAAEVRREADLVTLASTGNAPVTESSP